MRAIKACVFDAYGTLFDVHSAVAAHAARIGPAAQQLSALWRQRQTEYSWTRSLMGRYDGFEALTREALEFAMASVGVHDERLGQDLLDAYRRLQAYPEVPDVLRELRKDGRRIVILSNGTPSMLHDAVRHAGLEPLVDEVLSVDAVRVFKPHPAVYELATRSLAARAQDLAFLSSNPWDAAGAATFGLRVFWVNRSRQPAEYGFAAPERELVSLAELPAIVRAG